MIEIVKLAVAFALGMFVMWRVSVHGWNKYYEGAAVESNGIKRPPQKRSHRCAPPR